MQALNYACGGPETETRGASKHIICVGLLGKIVFKYA